MTIRILHLAAEFDGNTEEVDDERSGATESCSHQEDSHNCTDDGSTKDSSASFTDNVTTDNLHYTWA